MPPSVTRIRQIMSAASDNREVALIYQSEVGSGLKGGVTERSEWQIQGYREEYQFSVWVDANEFDAELEGTKSITVDGETKRILAVRPDSINANIRLDLGGRYGRS